MTGRGARAARGGLVRTVLCAVVAAVAALAALFAVPVSAGAAVGAAAGAHAVPGPANAPEYWFARWHIDRLWHHGVRGQGVTIAEIDTGVNASLPALRGRVLRGKDYGAAGGTGRVDRDSKPFGHGTAMASIMVGRRSTLGITGIAPGARILPIAVPLSDTTDQAPDDHVADAIRWAADHGAKIITMALGGTRDPKSNPEPCPQDEQAAIYYAMGKGAVLLAAAGNRAQDGNAVEQPGVCLGLLAVGAVDRRGTVAAFSSRHRYVDLVAPGVSVPSLGRVRGRAYAGNGTSQATAIASAVTALVWSRYPRLSGEQVVARLLATLDRHTRTPSAAYGYGELDGYRAVTARVPAEAPNPVYAAAAPFAARERAFARPGPKPPPPAGTGSSPPGHFEIGTASRAGTGQVTGGIVAGVLGLLGLAALILVPRLRRRPAAADAPPPPPAPVADEQGVEWHEILGPEHNP